MRSFWAASLILFLSGVLTSCINDDLDPCPEVPGNLASQNPAYYIEVNVQVPQDLKTRDGEPITDDLAAENECKIESIDLYFLQAEDEMQTVDGVTSVKVKKNTVLYALQKGDSDQFIDNGTDSEGQQQYTVKMKMDSNRFSGLARLAGKTVNLLAVCNPLGTINEGENAEPGTFQFTTELFHQSGEGCNGKVLPMANTGYYPIDNFKDCSGDDTEAIIAQIKTLFHPVGSDLIHKLGDPLEVERSVARLDLKDNTRGTHHTAEEWTYTILNDLYIKLDGLLPFNVNRSSFIARHVAGSDDAEEAAENYFFLERPQESEHNYSKIWFADPTWQWNITGDNPNTYSKVASTDPNAENHYEIPLSIDEDGACYLSPLYTGNFTSISSFTGNGHTPIKEHYPFTYISENTIPKASMWASDEETNELPKYATGVAFRFKLLETDGETPLTVSSFSEDEPAGASEESKIPSVIRFDEEDESIRITNSEGNYIIVKPEGAPGATNDKRYYYITYYGFIDHGDTANGSPMAYSVVRNTVYQMSINDVTDIPQPKEPDSFFLALEIKVLAWVKRDITVTF
ncbi:MAG: fimbria major subunit [Muribaculaceae bacterium]|nr:fimbria major subunit [Muribaculaceae bacterium]